MLRIIAWIFTTSVVAIALVAAGAGYFVWMLARDLPEHADLKQYEPSVMTRVYASDGSLIGEHARERRIHLPIEAIPDQVIGAFLSAEDRNFYAHRGLDFAAIGRAVLDNIENFSSGRRPVGASTITQQVAKNILLSSEVSFDRKLREALLALRIEDALTKDQILEIYLNEIYFGLGAYGIATAALTYFDKSVRDLTVAEAAYLAALLKAPANYHPYRQRDQALARRNWVLDRMWANGFLPREEAEAAQREDLVVSLRPPGAPAPEAAYFAEDVRRHLMHVYGDRALYEGGMTVSTTLDPELQAIARQTLTEGLVGYDRQQGWRGPVDTIDISGDWGASLIAIRPLADVDPWRLAVVLEVDDSKAVIGFRPERLPSGAIDEDRELGEIPLANLRWARAASGTERGRQVGSAKQVLAPGDVVYVTPAEGEAVYELQQVPEIGGALVAMNPHTGRVLAMVGGFSYDHSEFNRASQAMRQPGSAIKPFIYAAALDNGYLPTSIVDDSPIEIVTDDGVWRPQNYSREFYGPTTLRRGLESSRNVMTVRLADDLGMPLVIEYVRRFGIDEDMGPYLSMALGAGETTPLRLTAAYGIIANGGRKIVPTLIDRIQDRDGKTIYRRDERECRACNPLGWDGQDEPSLADDRERVLDPHTAYQVTSMLMGVIERGTATIVRDVGRTLAGKTGTTNDFRDAWFVGYSPDLVVGVFIGYDQPRSLGPGMVGGRLAAPIFRDFMKVALADVPDRPFEVPSELHMVEVHPSTGVRAQPGDDGVIVEVFRPGQEPRAAPVIQHTTHAAHTGYRAAAPRRGIGLGRLFAVPRAQARGPQPRAPAPQPFPSAGGPH